MLIAGCSHPAPPCSPGAGTRCWGPSYTAEDADIIGADADYSALETALNHQISNIESTHPGWRRVPLRPGGDRPQPL